MHKKNLVILRAGGSSLHHKWLETPAEDRNWDILLSFFDQQAFDDQPIETGVSKLFVKGGKFDGIFETCKSLPEYQEYDYIWLPDDDLLTDGHSINEIFVLMKEFDLVLGQPSLSLDSYFSHLATLHCGLFKIRYCNFVEVMAPCLHIDFFQKILPSFDNFMSGKGLDKFWCLLIDDPAYKAAILDGAIVKHTRPVGNVLEGKMSEVGLSGKAERTAIYSKFGVTIPPRTICYGAILSSGTRIKMKQIIGIIYMVSLIRNVSRMRNAERLGWKMRKFLKRHLFYKADLTQIELVKPILEE